MSISTIATIFFSFWTEKLAQPKRNKLSMSISKFPQIFVIGKYFQLKHTLKSAKFTLQFKCSLQMFSLRPEIFIPRRCHICTGSWLNKIRRARWITSEIHTSGGSKGTPPAKNFFIFVQFIGKIGQIIGWRVSPELAPPLGNPGSATAHYKNFESVFEAKISPKEKETKLNIN